MIRTLSIKPVLYIMLVIGGFFWIVSATTKVSSNQVERQSQLSEVKIFSADQIPTGTLLPNRPTPAPMTYELQETEVDLVSLQQELDFNIWLPQGLPIDTNLVAVHKIYNPGPNGGLGAKLTYDTSVGRFTITETVLKIPVKKTGDDKYPSAILQEVDINGQPGKIYDPGGPADMPVQSRAILHWSDGLRQFEIRGSNIDFDVLTQVARSIAP